MADNVTGQIGADQVFLDNAATEATLRLILQATLATTKEQRKAIQDLVQKAGLDPTKVQSANEGLSNIGTTAVQVSSVLTVASNNINKVFNETARIVSQFTNNSMQASGILGEFSKLGGLPGLVASGFQKVAEFQEASLKSYQQMTTAGVNFGGSLTDLRIAASNSYMSLDQFTNLMKNNSDTFVKLGGSANDGAMSFSKMSKSLISSEAGTRLLALGMTADEVNQNMANYISISGYRNKRDAATQSEMTQASANYMEQLNGLAEITGKSRQQQQEELAAASKNAAWQSQLAMMNEKERAKATAGMANALALGGKGAVDLFQSKIMGIAPDKAGAMLMATANNLSGVINQSADMVKDGSKDTGDMNKVVSKGMLAAQTDFSKYSKESMYAIIRGGGPLAESLQALGVTANQLNGKTKEEIDAMMEKKKLENTQAKDAAETQKAINEMGQVIMTKIVKPINDFFMPILNTIIQKFSQFIVWISKSDLAFYGLTAAVVLVTGLLIALKTASMVSGAKGVAGKMLGAITGGGGGGANVGKAAGGGLGSALSGIGKGVGTGLKGLASGLGALGKPNVFAGIAALGLLAGALYLTAKAFQQFTDIDWIQVGIGTLAIAGIATAAALAAPAAPFIAVTAAALLLLGASLWAMAEGLSALSESGGGSEALLGLGKNLLQFEKDTPYMRLGAAAIPLAAFGLSLLGLSSGLSELQKLDTSKLNKIADSLARIKDALPPERSLIESASGLIKSGLNALSNTISGGSAGSTSGAGGGEAGGKDAGGKAADPSEMLRREMQTLNKQTADLLRVMRESADNTGKTASILASRGNLFRA